MHTLEERLEELARRFFKRNVLPELSCLHGLLPGKRPPRRLPADCDSQRTQNMNWEI